MSVEGYAHADDGSPLQDLNDFRRDLLIILAGKDKPSGQEIKHEIEVEYGTKVNHGRLYPALDDLKHHGFIEKGELDRRTNYYTLTDLGRRKVAADVRWRSDQVEDVL